MMRAAGIAMILLGTLGIGVALVDWQALGVFQGENGNGDETTASADGSEQDTSDGDAASVDETTADQEVAARTTGDPENAGAADDVAVTTDGLSASDNGAAPAEAASDTVAARDPANVRVFEPDARPTDGDDMLWAEISAASDVVDEGSGHANFLVTLSEPAERSVVIIFSTVALSADDNEDYKSQRGTVTFEPGVVSAEIRTPLVDDDIKEDDEQFAIVLNGAPGIVSFKSRRITATIRDND